MPIEQFQTPLLWPEDNAQRNAGFQTSNPNVTVAPPTPATTPTEITTPQETNNPANNGVVPGQSNPSPFGTGWQDTGGIPQVNATQDEINKSITGFSLNNWTPSNNNLDNLYGISNYGITPEDVAKMPQAYYDANGNYVVRQVKQYQLSPETSKNYAELQADFQKYITPAWKQANSGWGISADFGVTLSETEDILRKIMTSTSYGKNKASYDPFVQAVGAARQALEGIFAKGSPNPNDRAFQDAAAKYKMAVIAMADKAKSQEMWIFNGSTGFTDQLNNYLNNSKKLWEIYKADEATLKDFLARAGQSMNKTSVTYQQLKDIGSTSAKEKLMKNPTYQDFLRTVLQHHPEQKANIQKFMSDSTISIAESKFITDFFVGDYAKNFFETREAAKASLDPATVKAMFAWFEDIIEIPNLWWEKADDELMKQTSVGGSFQFSLNAWGGWYSSWSSGSSYSGWYSTWQSRWQSYNTQQAKTRSVERTIW